MTDTFNDGALKAIFKQIPRLGSGRPTRISFLWSAPLVGTSGNPPVKRRGVPRVALSLDFSGKCHTGRIPATAWLEAPLLHCESLRIMV
jgi:hypothetical protein